MRKGWFIVIGLGVPVLLFTFSTLIWGATDKVYDAYAKYAGEIADHASPTPRPPAPIPVFAIYCEKGFEVLDTFNPANHSGYVYVETRQGSGSQLEIVGIREESPLPGDAVYCSDGESQDYRMDEYRSMTVPRKFHFAFGRDRMAVILLTATPTPKPAANIP